MKRFASVVVFAIAFLTIIIPTKADEGMWTLNNIPKELIKQKYNFDVTDEWLGHVQRSSARLPNCSSSFVSNDGLVFTNGHCVEGSVQALSTPQNNLYEKGFYAPTYAQELKTDRNLRVLMAAVDVTKEVNEATAKAGGTVAARQSAIAFIQRSASQAFDLTCEVVVLYQGGQYQNYCYKTYNDVRLVFASEKNVWFMGGDADNFEYPRYAMDVAFLRAYENGKPVKTPEHFTWSKAGANENELIFVSGHPGRTARLLTSEALKTERDVRVPFLLDLFRRREITLQQFMLRGKEQHRLAESDLFSRQNSRKLYVGKIRGLQDAKLVLSKVNLEKKAFADLQSKPGMANNFANGLIMVSEVQPAIRKDYARTMLLSRGLAFDTELYGYAQNLLSGNPGAAQKALEARLQAPPIDLEYETAKLTDSLTHLVEVFGAEDADVKEIMKWYVSPSDAAYQIVHDSRLSNTDEHRQLVQGGAQAIEDASSADSMLRLAKYVKAQSAKYAKAFNDVFEQERRGYALISDALFAGFGTAMYPDATFTLRLSYGTISGYTHEGATIPLFTTIGGVYKHSAEFGNKGDYKLPAKWLSWKQAVNLKTKLDFVSDLDITGGNSGSPVFNTKREIVGIVFDSNIQGLASDYDYNYASKARAVAVHSSGILEILKKIYHANPLVRELTR